MSKEKPGGNVAGNRPNKRSTVEQMVNKFEFDDLEIQAGGRGGGSKDGGGGFLPRKKLDFTSQNLYLSTKHASESDLKRLRQSVSGTEGHKTIFFG